MTALMDWSDALCAIAERSSTAIYRVHAGRRTPVSAFAWRPGLLVSPAHGVPDARDIELVGHDEVRQSARVVGRHSASNVALLATEDELSPLPRARAVPRVGQPVLALGRSSRGPSAALGAIHSVGGPWTLADGTRLERFVAATLDPGAASAGGPLLDMQGAIVGLYDAVLSRGAAPLVDSDGLEQISSALLAHGRVRRAYLGLGTQAVRLPSLVAEQRRQALGLIVLSVHPSAPAARAGLQLGDVLLAIDGAPLERAADLARALGDSRIDRVSVLDVLRAGSLVQVAVTAEARAA